MNRWRWAGWGVRLLGLGIAVVAAVVCPFVIEKLYTGRGGETPIRSALQEQPLLFFLGLCGVGLGLSLLYAGPKVFALVDWLNPRWVWRNRRGELILLVSVSCVCLVFLEIASRAVYARQRNFPLFHSTEALIYPPLYEQFAGYNEDETRVLLIGGSVLYFAGMDFPIERAFEQGARVYNLAQTAHSSLDSLTKLRYVLDRGYRFDYVIFYHGINEVRANNAPPELFSPDYGHYFFYRLVNTVFGDRSPVLRTLLKSSLFFRTYSLVMELGQTELFGRRFVHMAFPREDWLHYASEIRSKASFEANLKAVIALCEEYDAHLIVPRYAYHPVLDDWSEGRETPGYTDADMIRLTEQWGLPQHVLKGMKAHNAVIEDLKDRFQYVDTSMFGSYTDFVDPCHFSAETGKRFNALLADALAKR